MSDNDLEARRRRLLQSDPQLYWYLVDMAAEVATLPQKCDPNA